MIAIADYRLPAPAKARLETFADLIYLQTSGITYPTISGHPDIFICKVGELLICAPNLPEEILQQLISAGMAVERGSKPIGRKYPNTAMLNAVVTEKYFIHNLEYTDPIVKKHCSSLETVHVNQAYTRCSLIPLDERFITSDRGIEKSLKKQGFDILYVNPDGILLPGFDHGFIGGTCGLTGNKVIFIGSLDHYHDGQRIRDFLNGYEIVELYEGPLFDGGSLLFMK